MNNEQQLDEMVRDFCSIVPKSKSEVRRRILDSIAEAIAEERARVRGEIEGMKNKKHVCESREGWGCEYETAIDDILSSLDKESNPKK